jgi:hypothetical protein
MLLYIILVIAALTGCTKKIQNGQVKSISSSTFFKGQVLRAQTDNFKAVGKLIRTISPTKKGNCTGTLISSNIVVTASHCIGKQSTPLRGIDYTYNPTTIKFYPHYGIGPHLYSQVVKIYTPSASDDIAFIELKSDLGWLPNSIMKLNNQFSFKGENYRSLGYPGDY